MISRIYEQVFNNKAMNEVRALEKYCCKAAVNWDLYNKTFYGRNASFVAE